MKYVIALLLAVLCIPLRSVPVRAGEEVSVSAQSCILMEAATGAVLYEKAADEKRPMASTTKIMTALLTLESGGLDEEFIVDDDAIHVEGSSMGLVEHDIVTKRTLCYGMLLPSGNDAAGAAAVAVAGSIEDFAVRMNERAAQIGMTHTCFVTPSGLDAPGHGASAGDMALLTREALQNPDFRDICGQVSARVCFGNPPYERTLYNSNKLLGMYDGVIGVKTGFTDDAGRCLVSACEREGVTLICVTLHASDDWNDHCRLYDYGFARVRAAVLPAPDITLPVAGGSADTLTLLPEHEVTVGLCEGCEVTPVRLTPPFVCAPVQAGEVLGVLEYRCGGRLVARVPLTAADSIDTVQPERESLWKRLLGLLKGR